MDESILTSVKKLLGIDENYEQFDTDIVIHINSALMILDQIGVDDNPNFHITGKEEKWSDLTSNLDLIEAVKTYVYLRVRILFDPPTSSFVLDALKNQMTEYEWRINSIVDTGKEVNSE
jgi:hypothetical protein